MDVSSEAGMAIGVAVAAAMRLDRMMAVSFMLRWVARIIFDVEEVCGEDDDLGLVLDGRFFEFDGTKEGERSRLYN
jgi:hypothetical protein